MEQTALIILITGIIMVTYIPCLASQHPDNDDDGISPQSSESRTHAQKDGDLEGPYTFGRGHHRRNDRKSGGSRHGDRKSEHRSSHDHANRGRASSSKESTGTGNSNRERCPPASFMNRSSGICVACSSCPINQIIRRPCSAHRDTVCGPFYEFQQQQRNKDHSQSNQQEQLPKGPASAGVAASASDSAPPKTGPTQSKKFEGAGIHGDESAHSINTEDDGVGQTRGESEFIIHIFFTFIIFHRAFSPRPTSWARAAVGGGSWSNWAAPSHSDQSKYLGYSVIPVSKLPIASPFGYTTHSLKPTYIYQPHVHVHDFLVFSSDKLLVTRLLFIYSYKEHAVLLGKKCR